jgi:hypothetical protein
VIGRRYLPSQVEEIVFANQKPLHLRCHCVKDFREMQCFISLLLFTSKFLRLYRNILVLRVLTGMFNRISI